MINDDDGDDGNDGGVGSVGDNNTEDDNSHATVKLCTRHACNDDRLGCGWVGICWAVCLRVFNGPMCVCGCVVTVKRQSDRRTNATVALQRHQFKH